MASEVELLEVFRLGELAGDVEIVGVVGGRLAGGWSASSRFRETDSLTRRALRVQTSPEMLSWAAEARRVLGLPHEAIQLYQQRLELARATADRAGEAATLSNIGAVYHGLGDRQQAMRFFNQALPILRDVGNRAGEATTLNNIGLVYDGLGDRQQALRFYNQALPIRRDVGDRAGEATTLNNIGAVYNALGDRQQALRLYNQALPIRRDVGDRAGEATTRYNMAMIFRAEGRLTDAVHELEVVVDLDSKVQNPDFESDTAMLEEVRAELTEQLG